MTDGSWLWDEMELAAQQYREIPEYLRPVITAPGALVK